jgi:hypothetical protein
VMLVEGCKVRQHTQREPEKSISKTTFWWLVETRTSVSLSGHGRKKDTYREKPRRMCSRCILDVAHRIQATEIACLERGCPCGVLYEVK